MKRVFDIIIAFCGLLLFTPLLLFIIYIIKTNDGGPAFYRGARVGLYGKLFRIFKFRTMIINAEKVGGHSTSDDDSRITKVGKFLRKYKLDEFPQLINVLKGDMSIVGPRPEVKRYVDIYSEKEKEILSVRPGITDFASIWNPDEGTILAGSPDPDKTYLEKIRPKKIQLQLRYLKEKSFWVDIKIIFQTIHNLVFKKMPIIEEEN